MYTVYKHTTPGGKVYIGITGREIGKRWGNGYGYHNNRHFYNAIKLYGWENIQHEIIAEGLTKAQAAALEIELIAKHDSTNPAKGYNSSTGGEGGRSGFVVSAETRQKIRKANTGKRLSAETRQKIREARAGQPSPMKGRRHSEETRQKLREASSGANSAFYGKHLSESHKQNISQAKAGANSYTYGTHLSAETRQKISASLVKGVICIETGQAYSSLSAAAKDTGAKVGHISETCKGKRQTAGGYHWKYLER